MMGLFSCFKGHYSNATIILNTLKGGEGVDNLFLALAAFFAIGMMVLMIKYAKFIHNQPKIEAERRQDNVKEKQPSDDLT
jgi:hypothetical protein